MKLTPASSPWEQLRRSDRGRGGEQVHKQSVGQLLSWSCLPLSLLTTLIRKWVKTVPHFPWDGDPPPEKCHLPPEPCYHLLAANRSLTSQAPCGSQDRAFICEGGSLGSPLIKLQLRETNHLDQIQPHGFLLWESFQAGDIR